MPSLFVYAGLDYHQDSIRVCVMDKHGDVLVNRDVCNDVEIVRRWIGQCGIPQGIAIEACCGAADFAEQLHRRTGWPTRLAHPGYVKRLKQGPDKTDHHDAWLLADLVRIGYLPEVWLADPTTRQLRRLVRYRQGLVADRKNIKLRIRALLREERLSCPQAHPWTKAWTHWLSTAALGEQSRWVLDQELMRLKRINQDIYAVEQRLEKVTVSDETTQRLLLQRGIGLITAVTLRAEIGRFDRFHSGKQLSRFCGATPCNASSGRREADAGLVKAGNSALRAVIIQAAQRLARQDPRWKELKERLRRSKPANVATAAVANRWLRWLYYQMTTTRNPELAAV
jgi:transposase